MILITGAGKGLGSAIAQRLLENGEDVIGISRTSKSKEFRMFNADVANHASLKEISRLLRNEDIELTGLVNAAGIASMNLALLARPEGVKNVIETNLLGTIFSCQVFSPHIIRAGMGSIVNFSTIAVALGLEGESVYAASKSGVEAFSRTLARELSAHNLRVNCVAPGPIQTDLLSGVHADQIRRIVNQQIIKKQFEPSDVANVVEFLLSPLSNSISGQVLSVGGS